MAKVMRLKGVSRFYFWKGATQRKKKDFIKFQAYSSYLRNLINNWLRDSIEENKRGEQLEEGQEVSPEKQD